jgi:hypothetical protein
MANSFRQGEHICALYEIASDQLDMAAEYLADGLRAGERAYYVSDSEASLTQFRAALKEAGINTASMLKRGALVMATHAEAHLAGGRFDSERMLHLLNEAVEAALNDGFTGLRTCGDMSWLLQEPAGAQQVVVYEALLNQFFQGVRGSGMCQYDCRRMPPHLLDHALATHSSALLGGHHKPNPFYRPSAIALNRTAQPSDVRWKLSELRQRS